MKVITAILSCVAISVAAAESRHPCVYFRADELPSLREKAKDVAWAREIVARWHREVDSAVLRHADDPSLASSRVTELPTRKYTKSAKSASPHARGDHAGGAPGVTTPGAHRSPVRVGFPTSGRGRCPNAPRDRRSSPHASSPLPSRSSLPSLSSSSTTQSDPTVAGGSLRVMTQDARDGT